MSWNEGIGTGLIGIGLVFVIIGMFGMFRFKQLGIRLLLATKVDTVGLITVLVGAIFQIGFNSHSIKIGLIILFAIITNPIIAHAIAHSAHSSDIVLIGPSIDKKNQNRKQSKGLIGRQKKQQIKKQQMRQI